MALFISFDGPDGCGKSTQVRRLAATLRDGGREVVTTREPGGTPDVEAIRELIITGSRDRHDVLSEVLLFNAARRDHIRRLIRPALDRGAYVISDRYVASTVAFQGWAQGVDEALIWEMHRRFCFGLLPDVTVLIDLPAETALSRSRLRLGSAGSAEDRFESHGVAFQERVRQGYLAMAAAAPDRHLVVSGDGDPDTVAERIREGLKDRLTA